MVNLNTLGDMLLRKYTVDFIADMQHLASPIYNWAHGGKPVKTRELRYMGSTNEGHKGKTLFREQWFDKWSIQRMPWHVIGARPYESALGHQCHRFGSIYYFSMYPGEDEVCWSCLKPIPDNLIGLWKLQNYDIYTQLEEI